MLKFFMIFLGGGIGAYTRYLTSLYAARFSPNFPLGTLLVNIIGSFIMGVFFTLFQDKFPMQQELKLLITVGFCGALTTFSTFNMDIWNLFLSGNITKGITYIVSNLLLTILALILGVILAKQL